MAIFSDDADDDDANHGHDVDGHDNHDHHDDDHDDDDDDACAALTNKKDDTNYDACFAACYIPSGTTNKKDDTNYDACFVCQHTMIAKKKMIQIMTLAS